VWEVMNKGWVIQFKVILPPISIEQWYELADKLNNVEVNDQKDVPIWKWTRNKILYVKSVYLHPTKEDNGPNFKHIWKFKTLRKLRF
jgi:hypothetical protein